MQYQNKILIGERTYLRDLGASRFQIPIEDLGALTMREVPPHSHLEITGLAPPPGAYEAEFSILNSGDFGETEGLRIYGGVGFEVEQSEIGANIRKLRYAFPFLPRYSESGEPAISVYEKDGIFRTFAYVSLDFSKQPDTEVREAIIPFLEAFERLKRPFIRAFICHASEDKPVVRELALALKALGSEVWFDEWEIRMGDSIVQKISDGLGSATHLIVCLSTQSVRKPWVKKELSAALMRQLATASVKVLPVLLDECEIPPILADIKYGSLSHGLPGLVEELKIAFFSEVEAT